MFTGSQYPQLGFGCSEKLVVFDIPHGFLNRPTRGSGEIGNQLAESQVRRLLVQFSQDREEFNGVL